MLTDNAHQQIDLRTHENFEFELRKSDEANEEMNLC